MSDYPNPLDWTALRAERDRLRNVIAKREHEISNLQTALDHATDNYNEAMRQLETAIHQRQELHNSYITAINLIGDALRHQTMSDT